MEKEEFLTKRAEELAATAYQRDIVTFTSFLSLNELHMVIGTGNRNPQLHVESSGGYECAERQIVAFIPDALSYEWDYPIDCIRIENKGASFGQKLTHRDYLGALLNLGIERSTLGDILVNEDGAWLFCQNQISDFIIKNLSRVRHATVLPSLTTDPGQLPQQKYEVITGTVSSLRLDSILALAFRASRSSLVHNIEAGNVFINGRMVTSNGASIHEGDLISLRKKGKCKFLSAGGQSKKGRIFVTIHRYI